MVQSTVQSPGFVLSQELHTNWLELNDCGSTDTLKFNASRFNILNVGVTLAPAYQSKFQCKDNFNTY